MFNKAVKTWPYAWHVWSAWAAWLSLLIQRDEEDDRFTVVRWWSNHLESMRVSGRQHNSKSLTQSTIMNSANSSNDSLNTSTTRQLMDFEEMHVNALYHTLTQHNGEEEELTTCPHPHCDTIRSLLQHMRTCVEADAMAMEEAVPSAVVALVPCNFPLCASSRWILAHWEECSAALCPMCEPLQQENLPPPNLYISASTYTANSTPGVSIRAISPQFSSSSSSAVWSSCSSASEDEA